METTTAEQVFQKAFARGENEQRSLLLSEIQRCFDANDDYENWPLLKDSYRIRSEMQLALIGWQASGDIKDGSKGHSNSLFLEFVAREYESERNSYKQATMFSSLLKRHIAPERAKYENMNQSSVLDFNPHVRDAYKWNDEDLIEWLGRYTYITSQAHDDLRDKVNALFPDEQATHPSTTIANDTEQAMENEQEDADMESDGKQYSARSAAIVLLSIMDGLREGSSAGVNVSALSRLLSRLNGKSDENHKKYIKRWRDVSLSAGVEELKLLVADLRSLNLDIDLKRIEEMIEAGYKGKTGTK
jgi:hypothetical protein